MRFTPLTVDGAHVVDLEPFQDERGWFARAFCADEFAEQGLTPPVAQANLSYNARAGTLRGMHYQVDPAPEAKLIRVVRGALFDVVVDLRPDSPTYRRWVGEELSADNGRAMFVPEGCAHGFVTLADDTLAHYQVSAFYTPEAERGLRWDDPAIGIAWPVEPTVMSEKDRSWTLLEDAEEHA